MRGSERSGSDSNSAFLCSYWARRRFFRAPRLSCAPRHAPQQMVWSAVGALTTVSTKASTAKPTIAKCFRSFLQRTDRSAETRRCVEANRCRTGRPRSGSMRRSFYRHAPAVENDECGARVVRREPMTSGQVRSSNSSPERTHDFCRNRTTRRVTLSTNLSVFSPARISGRCKTAACVSASTTVTQIKAATSRSATPISSR